MTLNKDILDRLYIGTRDQTTRTQLIPINDCEQIIKDILTAFELPATIIKSIGFYTHGDGIMVEEATFIVELLFTSKGRVKRLAEEFKAKLNQECVGWQQIKMASCELV